MKGKDQNCPILRDHTKFLRIKQHKISLSSMTEICGTGGDFRGILENISIAIKLYLVETNHAN